MKRNPLILISLLLAAFVINLDTTIVNVALPTLVRELHSSRLPAAAGGWSTHLQRGVRRRRCWPRAACPDRFGRRGNAAHAGLAVFEVARSFAGGADRRARRS